jgi:hypothetical protein
MYVWRYIIGNIFFPFFLKLPPYTLTGFDLTTYSSSLLEGNLLDVTIFFSKKMFLNSSSAALSSINENVEKFYRGNFWYFATICWHLCPRLCGTYLHMYIYVTYVCTYAKKYAFVFTAFLKPVFNDMVCHQGGSSPYTGNVHHFVHP